MENTNFSIAGEQAQSLSTFRKIGVALFIVGCAILVNAETTKFIYSGKKSSIIAFSLMVFGAIVFTYTNSQQFRLFSVFSKRLNGFQILGYGLNLVGLGIIGASWLGFTLNPSWLFLTLTLGSMGLGILSYSYGSYAHQEKGIKNNYNSFNSLTSKGLIGFAVGIILTVFYIQLYWYSDTLTNLVHLFDPLANLLTGKMADKWFVYGTLYTFIILFLGIKFIWKYRHNRYQLIRTCVVIFSQLVFAYFLPQIMEGLSYNSATNDAGEYLGYYSTNPVDSWPLNYHFFDSDRLVAYTQESYQPVGIAYLVWGILLFLVVTPVLTYYVGKRWYCSWFCGCGGLAETAGDSFRQLSSKTTTAWKIERWVMHSVMVFVLLMTVAILLPFFSGKEFVVGFLSVNKTVFFILTSIGLLGGGTLLYVGYRKFQHKILLVGSIIFGFIFLFLLIAFVTGGTNAFIIKSSSIKSAYGFIVGSAFSGVIGVGFYPILGNRIWCRFGCPMAGYMGLFQRFKSRFRITTNGSQCISCGNCSTYCEQGIDVRAYAQKGENIVRASCVGCGICSAVCPRGVLKLENGPEEGRLKF